MLSFTCDVTKQRVLSRRLHQTGTLTLRTRVEIRGDYRAGPVPVSVLYETCFVPDEKFWERDERYPDEEGFLPQPDSIDGRVWLNGELLPLDSLELNERLFADFTKHNLNPWSIVFSPDVQRLIQTDTLIRIQPREDISYTVTVYADSLDRDCFIQYTGLIELLNVPPIPNIITPNGDGFNDTWKIDLDKFPNAELTIFDRWGEIIFESKNYLNDWDARYHGKHIADGTYFYILKVASQGGRIYKGDINVLNSSDN